ncbi:MAG: hypothetical protein AAB691_04505 [Patescibacteria group bacterium]
MSKARLEVCTLCGKHGRIILADGFIGPEFCFQHNGFQIVEEGLRFERFSTTEASSFMTEIAQSTIPPSHREVSLDFIWRVERCNQVRHETGNYRVFDASQIHAFLQRPPDVPMPSDLLSVLDMNFSTH